MRRPRTSWLMMLGLVVAVAVVAARPVSAAEGSSRPRLFSFEVGGLVREAKSICGAQSCSSFVLLKPSSGSAVRSEPPKEGSPTLELWQLEIPSHEGSKIEPHVQRLRTQVPNDAGRLAFCRARNSDGVEAADQARADNHSLLLMFQAQGSLYFVEPGTGEAPLGAGTRVGSAKWSAPARPWNAECSELLLVGTGEARLVELAGRGSRRSLLLATEFSIPLGIRRNNSGLTLESPPVRRIDQARDLIVVGPRVFDDLRIESLVFRPTADSSEWLASLGTRDSTTGDLDALAPDGFERSWSRLPGAEKILESRYLSLAGSLVLVAVTRDADKVGLLERKKLRLFRLRADRTRSGKLPFFETRTSSRLWQRLDVQFIDVTGDGLEDLVLVQPDGLGGEPTVVDVYVADAPLRFAAKRTRTILETGLVWWSLENDWNGDGLPDVVVLDNGYLQFHDAVADGGGARRRLRKRHGFWATEPSYDVRLRGLGNSSGDSGEVADVIPSSQRKVWVDRGILLVSTLSESQQVAYGEGGYVVVINGSEESGERSGANASAAVNVVHVVRAARPTDRSN